MDAACRCQHKMYWRKGIYMYLRYPYETYVQWHGQKVSRFSGPALVDWGKASLKRSWQQYLGWKSLFSGETIWWSIFRLVINSKENNKLEAGLWRKNIFLCWPIFFAWFFIACICHDLRNFTGWKRTGFFRIGSRAECMKVYFKWYRNGCSISKFP